LKITDTKVYLTGRRKTCCEDISSIHITLWSFKSELKRIGEEGRTDDWTTGRSNDVGKRDEFFNLLDKVRIQKKLEYYWRSTGLPSYKMEKGGNGVGGNQRKRGNSLRVTTS